MKRRGQSIFWLSIICILLPGTSVLAGKPAAGPKRYIFSRSSTPTTSTVLGLTGVPDLVNFPDGTQKCGVYITRINGGQLSLVPGCVLITVNNMVAQSPSAVDSMLRGVNNVHYSYVKMVGGLPTIKSGDLALSGASAGGGGHFGPPTPPGFPGRNTFGMPSTDNTPIASLESHMASLVNQDRHANKLSSLSNSSSLSALARQYANYLLATNTMSHVDQAGRNPQDRARQAGITCGIYENLALQSRAAGMTDMALVDKSEGGFMSEPPNQQNHRGNILLSSGYALGVGIARDGTKIIMVQEISDGQP